MEHEKLYKVTRKILDEIIKASDSRIMEPKDTLAKAIEKARAQLEVIDELADSSLTMDLTAPGTSTIPTPHQGPNTITVHMPGHPCEPYIGSGKPPICEFTEVKDQNNVWPPEQTITSHLEPLQTGR